MGYFLPKRRNKPFGTSIYAKNRLCPYFPACDFYIHNMKYRNKILITSSTFMELFL